MFLICYLRVSKCTQCSFGHIHPSNCPSSPVHPSPHFMASSLSAACSPGVWGNPLKVGPGPQREMTLALRGQQLPKAPQLEAGLCAPPPSCF